MVAAMINQMVQLKYSRGDELEADRVGMDYMTQAGYDPTAMLGVMRILAEASHGGRAPVMLSTHPVPRATRRGDQAVPRLTLSPDNGPGFRVPSLTTIPQGLRRFLTPPCRHPRYVVGVRSPTMKPPVSNVPPRGAIILALSWCAFVPSRVSATPRFRPIGRRRRPPVRRGPFPTSRSTRTSGKGRRPGTAAPRTIRSTTGNHRGIPPVQDESGEVGSTSCSRARIRLLQREARRPES
jgi:hypothetical protein